MQINCNFCQPNHTLLNAGSINRSINKNNPGASNCKSGDDRVFISPQGSLWNMVQNLTKQKEELIERKNELVNTTMENGGDMDLIKTQLDLYNEQIEGIDKQISDLYAQQAKDAVEEQDQKITNRFSENKTEEQAEIEKLSNIAYASDSIKQAEIISSVKSKIEGQAKVMESEVGMGELQADLLSSKGLGGTNVEDMIANLRQALDEKKELISDLKNFASDLNVNQGNQLDNTMDQLENHSSSDDSCEESDHSTIHGPNPAENPTESM